METPKSANTPSVSIIIPCYNCAHFIERCINSLRKQTFTDFEIIAVNDGSKDSTAEILQKLATEEERLQVINQPNAGVSAARNRGLDIARGKYIVFCDADDFVDENYISIFFDNSDADSTLVIQYPRLYNEKTGKLSSKKQNVTYGCHSVIDGIFKSKLLHNGYPFGKLFHTDIINTQSLRFREDISYKEDLIFILEYLLYVKSIKNTPESGYRYCIHTDSLSTKWKRPEEVVAINKLIEKKLDLLNVPSGSRWEFEEFCVGETLHLIYNAPTKCPAKLKVIKALRNSMQTDAFLIQNKFDQILRLFYIKRQYVCFDLLKRLTNIVLKIYN